MFSPKSLERFREERGMSQEQLMIELANAGCKVSRPTISKWETGDATPDANDLEALSYISGKPLKYFFAQ